MYPLPSPAVIPFQTGSKGDLRQEQQPPPSTTAIPLNSLSQALITVFKESFPLAREELKKTNAQFNSQLLDATNVRLDNAYLAEADLAEAWLVGASLREADLRLAQLEGATLSGAQLKGAHLFSAQLEGAYLSRAQLKGADLSRAQLEGTHLETAASLKNTKMSNATGLTPEQIKACKAKGAIFDEDTMDSSSQSPISPPAPPQSKDAQVPPAPSAQVNTPTPEADGSSTTSSKPAPES